MKVAQPTRRFGRILHKFPLRLWTLVDGEKSSLAFGQDIGEGGCLLLSTKSLKAGDLIKIECNFGIKSVGAIARVVHLEVTPSSLTNAGVEFLVIHPEDMELLQTVVNGGVEQFEAINGWSDKAAVHVG